MKVLNHSFIGKVRLLVLSVLCAASWNLSAQDWSANEGQARHKVNDAIRTQTYALQLLEQITDIAYHEPACQNWNIFCLTQEEIEALCPNSGGFCDPAGQLGLPACSIVLEKSSCEALGINPDRTGFPPNQPNTTVPSNQLPGLHNWTNPPVPPVTPSNVVDLCMGIHEIRHAMDFGNPSITECQSEQNAYHDQADCVDHWWNLQCNTPPPSYTQAECDALEQFVEYSELGADFNACLCQLGDGPEACAMCIQNCLSACESTNIPDCQGSCNGFGQTHCGAQAAVDDSFSAPPFEQEAQRAIVGYQGSSPNFWNYLTPAEAARVILFGQRVNHKF